MHIFTQKNCCDTVVSMLSFGKRFKELRQQKNVKTTTIHERTGLAAGTVSNIEKGIRPPNDDFLLKISTLVPELGVDYVTLKGWWLEQEFGSNPFNGVAEILPLDLTKKIPIKGTVSAGVLTWAEEHDLGYIIWPPDRPIPNGAFALKVKGDSMEPAVPDGSVVAVKPVERFKHGKKYVIMNHDGDTTLKVVQVSRDGLTLVPLNPYYQPITMRSVDLAKAWEVLSTTVFE